MRTKAALVGAAGILVAALGAARPMRGGMVGTAGIDPGIAKVADAFAAAVNAGDAAAAAAVFAEDGVEMPPGQPAIRGKAAIERYYRGMFAGPARVSNFRLTQRDGEVAGDMAYLTGSSTQTVAAPGAPPQEQAGKYLVVLRREGGRWRVLDAIHNADAACPPGAPTR